MKFFQENKQFVITGLIVGVVMILFINRKYIQNKLL